MEYQRLKFELSRGGKSNKIKKRKVESDRIPFHFLPKPKNDNIESDNGKDGVIRRIPTMVVP